ncbi:glycosyltransferase family 2 protein [Yoonia sp. SS1-5]|uniref:Glycosyltransferase family 2 protein n=1 Tax=Yoonia rhodophyticola TaxID=3137370 RepID=A0ABZ3JCY2_9RHOB
MNQLQTQTDTSDIITVIIAARNEEALITACLTALLTQSDAAGPVEVIVAANACTDQTVNVAQQQTQAFADKGWSLVVLDLADGGKLGALNAADAQARGGCRIYLDADVICSPELLGQIRQVLRNDAGLYATGTLVVAPAQTWVTRAYARIWTQLPFVKSGAVGAGFFAVNAAGRARWGAFPDIISDDTFVRLNFTPAERVEVPATYIWPMVEGFGNLVRVRRRQDIGVAEIAQKYPGLIENEGKARLRKQDLLSMALRMPMAFAVYMSVHVMVRMGRQSKEWTRGR